MASITHEVKLDVSRQNTFRPIIAKQNDTNSRFLHVTIVSDGTKINIPINAQISINVDRPDNQRQSFNGTVGADGTATITLSPWILAVDGIVTCDVSIIKGPSRLTTTSFKINVERAIPIP